VPPRPRPKGRIDRNSNLRLPYCVDRMRFSQGYKALTGV
jgi:hypothetical protein